MDQQSNDGSSNSNESAGGSGSVLLSSAAGSVERINKLVTVKPISRLRYLGEVGDLVIGRIIAVENKRWKVDILANREADLQLSSVRWSN